MGACPAGMMPVYSGAAAPDNDVNRPIVIVVAVTPGALAVLPWEPCVDGAVVAAPAGAVVALVLAEDDALELPQPAASRHPLTTIDAAAARRLRDTCINFPLSKISGGNGSRRGGDESVMPLSPRGGDRHRRGVTSGAQHPAGALGG